MTSRLNVKNTSGERHNCSFHSTLLSLFDILLHEATPAEDARKIIDNGAYSFLQSFNRMHSCDLTADEFIAWVKSHRVGEQYDAHFIQMLAPCLRMQVFQMFEDNALSSAIDEIDFKDENSNKFGGSMRESVFSHLYAIFGVSLKVFSPFEGTFASYDNHNNPFNYRYPLTYKPEAYDYEIFVHQNDDFNHFSSCGARVANQIIESPLSFDADVKQYKEAKSRALQMIVALENFDFVPIALQEDINIYFGEERCRLDLTPTSYIASSDILDGDIDSSAVMAAIHHYNIDADFIKQHSEGLSHDDCEIIVRYLQQKLTSTEAVDALKKELSEKTLKFGIVILDVLLALTILGLPYVIVSHVSDKNRFHHVRKNDNQIFKAIQSNI
ncbi:MAG: hypothetical protein VXW87_03385 [Pseudomonadota bacterium]|nr:hypothetical protein [Pseudomonadota bacterium]